ncbi:hypothetical protein [Spongiactinospora rosea]|uniref:hypothetical protein n=1 Tax=Spongiactinospora rosea TaxID=2248750 RepID=UPI0018F5EA86|nr:hypothetical protein [Spongiactinospora rosea]
MPGIALDVRADVLSVRTPSLIWIGHPVTVLAVVLLPLNDHLFKVWWPGPVSGKLSDVAGLIVVPPLLDLLIRRPLVSIALTGAAFTLVKTTAGGAALATYAWSALWGPAQVVADPTDLLALPALAVAWWARGRAYPGAVRRARAVIVIPFAVLAVAATHSVPVMLPDSAYAVGTHDGAIVVAVSGGEESRPTKTVFASGDGGWSWAASGSPPPPAVQTSACVPGEPTHCYRIVPGLLKVEQSAGGLWTTAWEVSPGDQDRLVRRYEPLFPKYAGKVASLGIAVQAVPGGHTVVVANGVDGIALRSADGGWHRLGWAGTAGFAAAKAVTLNAPGRYHRLVPGIALLAALAAALAALCCAAVRSALPLAALTMLAGGYCCLAGLNTPIFFDPQAVAIGLLLLAAGLPWAVTIAVRVRIRLLASGIALVAGCAEYYAVMTPYRLWRSALIGHYHLATGLAVLLGGVTAAAGVLAVLRYGVRHAAGAKDLRTGGRGGSGDGRPR